MTEITDQQRREAAARLRERCRNVSTAEGCFECSRCGSSLDVYLWAGQGEGWVWTLLDGAGDDAGVRFCPVCGAEVER